MDDGGPLARLRRLRDGMARRGAAGDQIAAVLIERFGVNPRVAFRHAAGLTQSQVADRYNRNWPATVPKTRKDVSYWECWQGPGAGTSASARAPSYGDLIRLAQVYACSVDDLLLGPRRGADSAPIEVSYQVITDILSSLGVVDYAETLDGGGAASITLRAAVGEGSITVRLSRRQFTELLATGGLAALLPDDALAAVTADAGVTDDMSTWRRTLSAHQAGHHLLTPQAHIAALTDVLADVSAVREEASSELRPKMRRIQAEYAEHISWLCREAGDLTSCWRWADRAAGWALESGDTAMGTYMMLRRATVALDHGDHVRATELARAARRTKHAIPAALDAAAQLYQARAEAMTGKIAEARLDGADELLAQGRHRDDGPAYLRYYTPEFGELQRATCYVTAGMPSRAVTILQARITSLPNTHHRDRAVHLVRLATAHAVDRAPDAAAIAGLGALIEARRAGSVPTVTDLERVDGILTRGWPRQPKVREFHDALISAQAAVQPSHPAT
ncbi:hypothetical protein DP939_07980 [Spongiactinospora rosea]|uniref:XRE family transcriptional regulator n=1 Tax=Spongiactinospora rosea TaxID=2248750 RepID=A0A366M473_9ACTN|nr:hypothetical protein [Spongiactinospora rosea]RBQ20985.1 hypothetical protein DP939_07980 [Spongiactinospora rosea]